MMNDDDDDDDDGVFVFGIVVVVVKLDDDALPIEGRRAAHGRTSVLALIGKDTKTSAQLMV